jgi:uncharacterized membrane protein HdeD (DUF308 family)
MTTLAAPMTPAAMTARRARRAQTVRGALLLAFGLILGALVLLAFRVPHITVSTLVRLLSGFLILEALAAAVPAVQARQPWPGWVPQALASLAAGLLMLVVPHSRWVAVFGVWAIVSGVLDGSKRLVVSVLSLALGVMLLVSPVRDHALLLLAVSAYSIVTGSLRLFLAGRVSRPPARP